MHICVCVYPRGPDRRLVGGPVRHGVRDVGGRHVPERPALLPPGLPQGRRALCVQVDLREVPITLITISINHNDNDNDNDNNNNTDNNPNNHTTNNNSSSTCQGHRPVHLVRIVSRYNTAIPSIESYTSIPSTNRIMIKFMIIIIMIIIVLPAVQHE